MIGGASDATVSGRLMVQVTDPEVARASELRLPLSRHLAAPPQPTALRPGLPKGSTTGSLSHSGAKQSIFVESQLSGACLLHRRGRRRSALIDCMLHPAEVRLDRMDRQLVSISHRGTVGSCGLRSTWQ
jgi:hypothetical protein